MLMPFGVYKGEDLKVIPTNYLNWLYGEMETEEGYLLDEIIAELDRRS